MSLGRGSVVGRCLLALGLLLLAGCSTGDDDDAGAGDGSTEAFCDEIEQRAEEGDLSTDPAAQAEQIQEFEEIAPDEIADDLDTIQQATEQLEDLSAPSDAGPLLEADFIEAVTNVTAFMLEECDLDPTGGEADLSDLEDFGGAITDSEEFSDLLDEADDAFSDLEELQDLGDELSDLSDSDDSLTDQP